MGKLSEEELAELQDPENWQDEEDADRPAVKAPRAVVSVAFSREDFEKVAAYAKRHGKKTSEVIRRAVLEQVSPKRDSAVIVSVSGGVQTGYVSVAPARTKVEIKVPEPEVLATA